ncbi:porin family protein [Changchengzhania lutea]|uniref:hypothetical protein n=1 Tax=Changchengzhania lutea TaxID=2049305 RepID=UPI00115CCF0F|nr:hypothetical protein [Changchengzhania lutea]
MKNYKKAFLIILVLLFSNILFAQNKWSAEFRPGISEDFKYSSIKTGFGFEVTVAYRFMEHLSAYAGWGYNNFGIEDSDFDLDGTGYAFGLQFIRPIGSPESLSYLFKVGDSNLGF